MKNYEKIKAQVAYNDLREWYSEADKLGELRVASGYNWEEQIGMAAELLQHDENAPVGLFDKIRGEFIDIIEWTDSSPNTLVSVSATQQRDQERSATDRP